MGEEHFADRDAPGLSHYFGAGDVNGDGRTEIASAAKLPGEGSWFAWWEPGGDPRKPWRKHILDRNQEGATNILATDVDGDGLLDFVASCGHGVGLKWYRAPNWEPKVIDAAVRGPHALAVGDINGDGRPDIAVGAKDDRAIIWYENLGRGKFQARRIAENQSSYDLRLADLDDDGDLDVLIAGHESRNVVWYENPLKRPNGWPGGRER